MCNKHRILDRRYGSPFIHRGTAHGKPVSERLSAEATHIPETGCLVWGGRTNGKGYGYIKVKGKLLRVHRLVWETEHGPIPEGHVIDHLCENKLCFAVLHLEAVTNAENLRRWRYRPLWKRIEGIKYKN